MTLSKHLATRFEATLKIPSGVGKRIGFRESPKSSELLAAKTDSEPEFFDVSQLHSDCVIGQRLIDANAR